MSNKFFCGDCHESFEAVTIIKKSYVKSVIGFIISLTLFVPVSMGKAKSKTKKKCDYCGSDFILPDTPRNREFLQPTAKKN